MKNKEKNYPHLLIAMVLGCFFMSGTAGLVYEVIWVRMIDKIIGSAPFAVATVLSVFMGGLALGSYLVGRLIDRLHSRIALLNFYGLLELVIGLYALVLPVLIGATIPFISLIVPTLLLGAAFPLVNRIYIRSVPMLGRSIGMAYAVNTIGAILGAFAAGFILIPWMGKQKGLGLIFLIQFSFAALSLVHVGLKKTLFPKRLFAAAVLGLAGVLLCLHFPSWNHALLSRGWYRDFAAIQTVMRQATWFEAFWKGSTLLEQQRRGIEVVFHGEGVGGFTTVERETTSVGTVEYALFNSGKADASSHNDRSTQTLSGIFRFLFHPRPEKVMVLGLASGMTPGEVLHYPVKQLDILEINDQVVKACRQFFTPWNNNCLNDPRTRLILQDGRNHLALTRERYDVIISEPSNPWMAGLANLYTQDFFQLVKNRLTAQGLFAQWIQSYEMDWDTFALLGRTFTSVFPGGMLIKIGPVDYMLLARADNQGLAARANIRFAGNSTNAAFVRPEFLAHLIVTEDLGALFGPGPVHTDNMPILEFSAPRQLFSGYLDIDRKASGVRYLRETTRNIIEKNNGFDALLDLIAFAASVNAPLFSILDYAGLPDAQKKRYLDIACSFCGRESVPTFALFGHPEPKHACAEIQIERIRRRIAADGARPADRYNLGLALIAVGRSLEAIEEFKATIEMDPMHADGIIALGLLMGESAQWEETIACFRRGVSLAPHNPQMHRYLGMAEAKRGEWDRAISSLTQALRLAPDDVPTLNERGAAWMQLGKFREARADFSEALRFAPEDAESHNSMAMALFWTGELEQAAFHLLEALRFSPENDNVRYNLNLIARHIKNSAQK